MVVANVLVRFSKLHLKYISVSLKEKPQTIGKLTGNIAYC